ncbi:uncharacterized protein [Panulirus ornatus]|uniref:uncharacterized protein n=1 Tax=Panulirus ornatus TaxID=150431 RepID=UPI003A8C0BB6
MKGGNTSFQVHTPTCINVSLGKAENICRVTMGSITSFQDPRQTIVPCAYQVSTEGPAPSILSLGVSDPCFRAGDGQGDGAWRPTLTESNVCYTFTPPSNSSLSYVAVLNTDYRAPARVRTNNTLDLLLNSLHTSNRPFTHFALHDRREQVYTWRQGYTGSLSSFETSQMEISVTVKTDSRLSRGGHLCESSPRYSQATCFARCRATYYAEKKGCRLPYITWRPDMPLCNETQYASFPRQLGVQTSQIYVVKDVGGRAEDPTTAACGKQCPLACTRRMFSFSSRLTSRKKSVMICCRSRFSRSTYDWLREEDGYSWSQLVSDVGGAAGFMMGASFLSVCSRLLRLLHRRRAPPPKHQPR